MVLTGKAPAMLLLFARTALVYLLILLLMRFMGKRQLGELQPSDLTSTILISNLASIPIEQPELPFWASLTPILLIACLEILVSWVGIHCRPLGRLLSGKPIPVIRGGQIDQDALKQLRFSAADLLAALRAKDIFSPEEVAYAVIETDGALNVCKSPQADTPTRQDLDLPCPENFRPTRPFVVNGEVLADNLGWCGHDRAWLDRMLKKKGLGLGQVLLALGDDSETLTLIQKEKATAQRR